MRWRLGLVLAVTIAAVLILLAPRISRFIAQDRCLDNGGRWSHVIQDCEFANAR